MGLPRCRDYIHMDPRNLRQVVLLAAVGMFAGTVLLLGWMGRNELSGWVVLLRAVFLACACCVLYRGLCIDRDWFSPFTLFSTYYICILLYSPAVSNVYLPELTVSALLVMCAGSVAFCLGMWSCGSSRVGRRTDLAHRPGDSPTGHPLEYSHWWLLAIGLCPLAYSVITKGLPAVAWRQLSSVEIQEQRLLFDLPIVGSLACLTSAAIVVAASTHRRRDIILVWTAAIFSATVLFTKGSVASVLFFIGYGIGCYRLIKSKQQVAVVVCLGVVLALLMGWWCYYARTGFGSERVDLYELHYTRGSTDYFPNRLTQFYPAYMYMVTPFANCQYVMQVQHEYSMGIRTLWPVISMLQLGRLCGIEVEEKPFLILPYNTHTFLADFYLDFGPIGAVVAAYVLGIVVYRIYLRSRHNADALIRAEYAFWGFATFLMFFSNHFTSVGYPLRSLVIIEVYRHATAAIARRWRSVHSVSGVTSCRLGRHSRHGHGRNVSVCGQ